MNFYTDKIDNIRKTITNVDSTAFSTSASFIAPKEKLQEANHQTVYRINQNLPYVKYIKFLQYINLF